MKAIQIRGARTHNLKNISLDIPRDKLVVITGVSGSGKSSLAFDTLYAEGQRRYVESLSSYARQFLGLMDRADVDDIEGLSPAIAIEQKSAIRNPRSTVGTSAEINDYLRLLFARTGVPRCPVHNLDLEASSVAEMTDHVLGREEGEKIMILAPVVRQKEILPPDLASDLQARGYTRVRIDGQIYQLPDWPELKENQPHTVEIVVDRLKVRNDIKQRVSEDFEAALRLSGGLAVLAPMDGGKEELFSDKFACPYCGFEIPELEPKLFSFNSPQGACPTCSGMGKTESIDTGKVVSCPTRSLAEGAVEGWGRNSPKNWKNLSSFADDQGVDLDCPWQDLSEGDKNKILFGKGPFAGIIGETKKQEKNTKSEVFQNRVKTWKNLCECQVCGGSRLGLAARSTYIGKEQDRKNFPDVSAMPLKDALRYFETLKLTGVKGEVGKTLIEEIKRRLQFLINVGLGYLTLDRGADTLSGGEAQRIRLAGQIGSGLSGVMYILDEPSIGLHQVDNDRLIDTLKILRDKGNSVIVVEHDEDTMRASDWIVDLGPGAGENGGEILAAGTPLQIEENPVSLTGKYLSGKLKVGLPDKKKKPGDDWLVLKGASGHNLKKPTLRIPVGLFTTVCGVSGSGKSTLVNETLYPAAARNLNGSQAVPLPYESIEGLEYFDKVINVDQSPIGKTPKSNPATYTGCFTTIRELFAQTPLAKERGYGPERFSFNVKGGRCEACQGEGLIKVEMQMLPDMYVPCDVCHGNRYNRETLEVLYKGLNIAQVLDLTVRQASKLFENIPILKRKLGVLEEVGLGYIRLGQSSATLSGGEAQRVKLALELSKRATGKTLFILDEPTTGLHFQDITMLLRVLEKLKESGNTIVVIEHNLDVIRQADWLVEVGPEGGCGGGQITAEGTPEEVGDNPSSITGTYIRN